jgi:hypothetical protein
MTLERTIRTPTTPANVAAGIIGFIAGLLSETYRRDR